MPPMQEYTLPTHSMRALPPFVRFLAVGLLNAAFGYSCFAVLLFAGMHYAAALLLATVAGVLFNFNTVGALVFYSRDNRRIVRFVATYVLVYVVNVLGLQFLSWLGIGHYYRSGAAHFARGTAGLCAQ